MLTEGMGHTTSCAASVVAFSSLKGIPWHRNKGLSLVSKRTVDVDLCSSGVLEGQRRPTVHNSHTVTRFKACVHL